jgi:hypothetical protein
MAWQVRSGSGGVVEVVWSGVRLTSLANLQSDFQRVVAALQGQGLQLAAGGQVWVQGGARGRLLSVPVLLRCSRGLPW